MITRVLLYLLPALVLAQTPSIDAIVDNTTAQAGPIAAGGLISINGTNLATATAAPLAPLPTTAGGATVMLGGKAIPIVSAAPTQIVAFVPLDTPQTSAPLTVTVGGSMSAAKSVTVADAAPAIVRWWTSALRGTTSVRRGEYLTLYCTGLGDVSNPPKAGANGVSSPLSAAKANVMVQIGGAMVMPAYVGLAPYEPYGTDAVGIYQIDVMVPLTIDTGDAVPVVVAVGSTMSPATMLSVQMDDPQQVITQWTQMGANGPMVRAITSGATCPVVQVDGVDTPMQVRSTASLPLYPVTSCDLPVPAGASSVALSGTAFPMPKASVQRITVFGDTGCRLDSTRAQACLDPVQWPAATVASSVANTQPDLIVHMGDAHYREAACPVGNAGCAASPWGYNWHVWYQDVFAQFGPAFAAAPLVMIRGNHEMCSRAGEGWFRYLDPRPLPDTCPMFTDPYLVPAGPIQIFVIDSAEATDTTADPALVAKFKPYYDQLATVSGTTWVAMHHPMWAFDSTGTRNLSMQVASNNTLPDEVQMVLGGHIHTFQTLTFSPARTPQMVVGNGADVLQAYAAGTTNFNGKTVGGASVVDSALYTDYGFSTFDWNGGGWDVVSRDTMGNPVMTCTVGAKAIPCKPVQ